LRDIQPYNECETARLRLCRRGSGAPLFRVKE